MYKHFDFRNASPHGLVIRVALSLGLLYVISPVSFAYSSQSMVWVLGGFAVFILFSFLGSGASAAPASVLIWDSSGTAASGYDELVDKCFRNLLVLSALGVSSRFYDFFLLRGFSFADGFVSLRLSLQSLSYGEGSDVSRASAVSALGAILYGFVYPLSVIVVVYWHQVRRLYWRSRFAVILLFAPVLESVFNAGVMSAAFFVLCIFFSLLYRMSLFGRQLNRAIIYRALGILVVLLWFGSWSFLQRVELMYGSVDLFLIESGSFARPSTYLAESFGVPFFGPITFAIFWFSGYVLQGPSEFSFLVDHFRPSDHMNGFKQFFIFDKFFSVLGLGGGFSASDVSVVNPRPGRYQTMFGDMFIDYGLLGVLVQSSLLGFVAGRLYALRSARHFVAVLLYPFVQSSIVFGFLINVFSSARLYFLVAALLTACLWFVLSFGTRRFVS